MITLPDKTWFRPDEVAEILCISRRTIFRRVESGQMKLTGKPLRMHREDLLAYLDKCDRTTGVAVWKYKVVERRKQLAAASASGSTAAASTST